MKLHKMKNQHTAAVLQALLVTFLWSTSFIIIKKLLSEIPPLTFAGLRYLIASIFLLPFLARRKYRNEIASMNMRGWLALIFLGIMFYAITQGAQFVGLSLLPSATVSLMLNFSPVIVLVLGVIFLGEKPAVRQICGIAFFLAGVLIFFIPSLPRNSEWIGIAVMGAGVVSTSVSAVAGRRINSRRMLSPLTVTVISMSIGAVILTSTGIALNGFPQIAVKSWIALLWMSLVNTAFAFTLWNRTLRTLTAMESSIINGTMLIQIAVLAWIFLGEGLTAVKIFGMIIAAAGAVLVQLKKGG